MKNKMGETYNTHGEEMCKKFSSGNLKERDRLGVLGVDGRTILKWILKK
jgi:hypothetical protein